MKQAGSQEKDLVGQKSALAKIRPWLWSLVLGWAGFTGAFFSLEYTNPPYTISLLWSLFLPSMAALGYGPRFALLAALPGLSCLIPFAIWSNNGWANVITALLYLANFVWIGWTTRLHEKNGHWSRHPLFLHLPFVIIYAFLVNLLYPWFFSLNPAPWAPGSPSVMPSQVIQTIATKGVLTFYVELLGAWLLLRIPPVRRILGLRVSREMRKNHLVFFGTLGGSFLTWVTFIIFNRIFLDRTFPHGLLDKHAQGEDFALVAFMATGFMVGSLVINRLEALFRAEDEFKKSKLEFQQIMEHSTDVLWVYDPAKDRFTYLSPSILQLRNYSAAEAREQPGSSILVPGDRERIRTQLAKRIDDFHLGGGQPLSFTDRILQTRKDGEPVSTEVSSTLLMDPGGTMLIVGVSRDISQRERAESMLKQTLGEKENLLRELHHRTKNNMAVIISLLHLHAQEIGDKRLTLAFRDATRRIQTMALVHQQLYESGELGEINWGDYVRHLAENVLASQGTGPGKVLLHFDLDQGTLPIELALNCGLMVNELLTNALKYACPEESTGSLPLNIRLASRVQDPEDRWFSVTDQGPGLADGFDPHNDGHMGMKVLFTLAENQLNGTIDFSRPEAGGLEVRVGLNTKGRT